MIKQFFQSMASRYGPLDEKTLNQLLAVSNVRSLKKGELLFEAGASPKHSAIIVSGALKYFYVDEESTERTVDLCIEQDVISNFDNYLQKRLCDYSVQATQKSVVVCLDNNLLNEICFINPQLVQLGTKLVHAIIKRKMAHIHLLSMKNPVSRYRYLLEQHPHLLQSFSTTELAKYLYLSREALSRARLALLNEARSICDCDHKLTLSSLLFFDLNQLQKLCYVWNFHITKKEQADL